MNEELELTIRKVYENFLDPMKDNIEYQAKKPGAIRQEPMYYSEGSSSA